MSDEHFTVDGTLIEAWASQKSFRPKDGSGKRREVGPAPCGIRTRVVEQIIGKLIEPGRGRSGSFFSQHGRYFAQSPQSFAEYAVVGVGKSFSFTGRDWQRSCLKICGGLVSRISSPKRTTMKPVRRILVGLSLALVGLLFVPLAKADGIVVTDTTTGSGSLDGTVFINALVTLTFVGDTTNVTGTTIFQLPGTATLSVGGIGSDTFTDNIQVVVNQTFTDGGFGDFTNSAAIIFTFNPAFATYSLTSSIGPLSGSSALGLPSVDNTVHGTFNLKSAGTSTFTATVTTLEPSSLFMLGTGLLALVGLSWRRNSLATSRSVLS
jgi:hypothetical protein